MLRQRTPIETKRTRNLPLRQVAYHCHRHIEGIMDASQTQQVLTGRQQRRAVGWQRAHQRQQDARELHRGHRRAFRIDIGAHPRAMAGHDQSISLKLLRRRAPERHHCFRPTLRCQREQGLLRQWAAPQLQHGVERPRSGRYGPIPLPRGMLHVFGDLHRFGRLPRVGPHGERSAHPQHLQRL